MLAIYVDGGVYTHLNRTTWAAIVVENDVVINIMKGELMCSGGEDVETAESSAFYHALEYVKRNPANYVIYTDSRSLLDKVQGKCHNATRNPHVKYAQRVLAEFKASPLPISLQFVWKPRRSNDYMKMVDDLCHIEN
jgi:ribonuclease HI